MNWVLSIGIQFFSFCMLSQHQTLGEKISHVISYRFISDSGQQGQQLYLVNSDRHRLVLSFDLS